MSKYIISESRLDKLIYDYLDKNFTPDDGWLTPVRYTIYFYRFHSYQFKVNDKIVFVYVKTVVKPDILNKPESLIVWDRAAGPLTDWFGDMWKPVMVKWFEDHTGLEVKDFDTV